MKIILNEIELSCKTIEGIDYVLFNNYDLVDIEAMLKDQNFELYQLGYFSKDETVGKNNDELRKLIYDIEGDISSAWEEIIEELSKIYEVYLSSPALDFSYKDHRHYFVIPGSTNGSVKYISEDETYIYEDLDVYCFGQYKNKKEYQDNSNLNDILKQTPFISYLYHEVVQIPNQSMFNKTR